MFTREIFITITSVALAAFFSLFLMVNYAVAMEVEVTPPSDTEAATILAAVAGDENKAIIASIVEEEQQSYVSQKKLDAEVMGDHRGYLYYKSMEENLSYGDAVALEGIAQCESGFNPYAKNPTSTASGIMQFLDTSWAAWGGGYNVFDGFRNIDGGVRYYQAAGTRPWVCPPMAITPYMSEQDYMETSQYVNL